jgi:hypothetical protein
MTVATVLSTSLFGMIISPLTPIILGFIAQQSAADTGLHSPQNSGVHGIYPRPSAGYTTVRTPGFSSNSLETAQLGHKEPRIYARRILHP